MKLFFRRDYAYEPETFRLATLETTRLSDSAVLQDISYVYDPVGNIVSCRDDSHNRVFTTTGPVEPVQDYEYDALYRLTNATGRMHAALADAPFFNDPQSFKQSRHTLLNNQSLIATYERGYSYDDSGNLTEISQTGTNPFTREVTVQNSTNRALMKSTGFEPDPAADWEALGYFDANGNQTRFDHLAGAAWNYRDNLASVTIVDRGGDDDAEYYVYDAGGQRSRKVTETFESGQTVKRVVDEIYLDGVEVKRVRSVDVATSTETQILARSDLHVMDDEQRIAIVTHWTQDDLRTGHHQGALRIVPGGDHPLGVAVHIAVGKLGKAPAPPWAHPVHSTWVFLHHF
ncbi:MAG: hypothetical protein R6V85_13900 [Polyangia bacterium]